MSTQITLDLDDAAAAGLDKLKGMTGHTDNAVVIGNALAVYASLHERKRDGAELIVREGGIETTLTLK
jgi:hypothetical protein